MKCRRYRFHTSAFLIIAALAPLVSIPHHVSAQSIEWDRPGDGLAIGVWDPSPLCPDVGALIVSDIDPLRYRISVHYFRNEPLQEPPDIHEWQRRTGHDLVFNAGLFRENFTYLGLLYAQGKSLGGKRHASWMGLFVAEPIETGPSRAAILDLSIDPFDEQRPPYGEAAQSLMLLDRTGKVRVKQSGKQSQQTIVGELQNGHIVIMKTTEVASLYAIGRCLHEAYPHRSDRRWRWMEVPPRIYRSVLRSKRRSHRWLAVVPGWRY
jgi:hypothetical protein